MNPFYSKQKISLRVRNFTTPSIKVNDKVGNPIDVAAVVVWAVRDTAQAAFDVDDFDFYIKTQCEISLRDVVSTHPYDATHDDHVSLRGNTAAISDLLKERLTERYFQDYASTWLDFLTTCGRAPRSLHSATMALSSGMCDQVISAEACVTSALSHLS